ncbi:nitrite/sulfite reductase [Sedimenticola hydrogenitrophicus]|uniref:nitrite/sulfite reductase n=1 Tax=Sedimenticola hydrogenitrophicus TaxID=2967975 RepID=UPI0023B06BEA|nr:nitrite/sulfite reductase [Sedimenticola hydrogenitrophicus]
MITAANPLIDSKDFDDYEQHLQNYLQGNLDPHRFVAIRLNLGIYAQRQDGMCMVRAKLPGGRMNPRQLLGFAEAAEKHSGTTNVHITTRQDIQFHFVPLERTPQLQRTLAEYGIATREAGGNTVRNITGCALSGACPAEHVDINAYIDKVANYFIRHPLTASMPRKFKLSFSACESDCANGLVHDLGVIATRKDGRPGFRLLAAGGLGGKPKEAIVLESFIEENQLIPAIEAVLSVHDKYSDRKRKMRSRIKFLLDRFGAEGFIEKYRAEYARTSNAYSPAAVPVGVWRERSVDGSQVKTDLRAPTAQHQEDLNILPVSVPDGRLEIETLRGLADLLVKEGLHDIRTTADQNLSIFNVPTDRLGSLTVALKALGLKLPRCGDLVVSCPGTATCPLGITASRQMAPRLSGGVGDLSVRVNGCQNGCANATISDIGLYGKGRRHHGRLVPSYTLQLGGNGSEGGSIGLTGPDIPAVRVPSAVSLLHDSYHADRQVNESFRDWAHREGREYFDELLGHLSNVGAMELPFLTRDHGDSSVFKVESMGVGECAGSQAAPADKLLLDARYESDLSVAFAAKNKQADAGESLENQITYSGQALLEIAGLDRSLKGEDQLLPALRSAYGVYKDELDKLEQFYVELRSFQSTLDELQLASLITAAKEFTAWAGTRVEEHNKRPHTAEQPRSGTDG